MKHSNSEAIFEKKEKWLLLLPLTLTVADADTLADMLTEAVGDTVAVAVAAAAAFAFNRPGREGVNDRPDVASVSGSSAAS